MASRQALMKDKSKRIPIIIIIIIKKGQQWQYTTTGVTINGCVLQRDCKTYIDLFLLLLIKFRKTKTKINRKCNISQAKRCS